MKRMVFTIVLGLFCLTNFTFAQTYWVTSSSVPADAIVGGQDAEGRPLYVCHGGTAEGYGLQPGKYEPELSGCDFGYDVGRSLSLISDPGVELEKRKWRKHSLERGYRRLHELAMGRRVDWKEAAVPLTTIIAGRLFPVTRTCSPGRLDWVFGLSRLLTAGGSSSKPGIRSW